ncbi:hypothetical protein NDU88_003528 [Pleurodeles waltl]|uniref:Uncharacterized protein n=1 Tax=Pleurodeles waltl TaxID=8319 RepID=A0AAV7MQU2_PLEWA|nr:hypothetical protein NDU88_003528 [Pleurodeles waltl]
MHKRPKIVPTSTGIRFGPKTAEKPSDDRWEVVIEGSLGPPHYLAWRVRDGGDEGTAPEAHVIRPWRGRFPGEMAA